MTLEICIDRFESALAARAGGANRIEVCGALAVDGITPSYGLVEQCVELGGVEVVMMIRPHAGGFCYSEHDVDTMIRDICAAQRLGVQGVALGLLRSDGRIDRELCRRLVEIARPLSVTFHRAFDLTPDPLEALEWLLEIGVDRLLMFGQAATAVDGDRLIRELVERAAGRVSVMAGAGITPRNVVNLMRATGVREIHASAIDVVANVPPHPVAIVRGSRVTKENSVRGMVEAMREAGAR